MAMNKHAATEHRAGHVGLAILDGVLGVTATIGGLCLLLRVPFVTPPTDLLAGSPFGNYTIPGLALLVLVGGSGLLATALVVRRSPWGTMVSALAALMILVFEAVELVVIGFTVLLALYVLLGCAILALVARYIPRDWSTAAPRHASPQAPR
jgi:hypothetical protein